MMTRIYFLTLALSLLCGPIRSHAGGIPEPGLVIYGAVRNQGAGNVLMTVGTLTWSVTASGSPNIVSVPTPLANINGQFSYRVRIPYETVVGSSTLGPNSFAIPSATTAYSRTPSLFTGGQTYTNVVILGPATAAYNFGATTRGMVMQVDLQVNAPGVGVGLSLPSGTLPSAGTSGSGSGPVLMFTRMGTHPDGGVLLEWTGTAINKNYMLLRAEQMTGDTNDFKLVGTFPPLGASGTNQFWDSTAVTNTTYFYQLQSK